MFARLTTVFTVASLAMFATASAVPRDQCTTGSLQCCNSLLPASDPSVALIAGLLGIVLGPITGLVGLTCSPITVIGGGGSSCNAQTVCCTGNNYNGLLVVGCSPININV